MDVEEALKLFDFYWFGHEVIKQPTTSKPELSLKPELSRYPSGDVSCSSGELSSQTSFISGSSTPRSVLPQLKLHTVFSGKEETSRKKVLTEKPKEKKQRINRGVSTKSLSDLEFEELKGFMDLGFAFTDEDKSSNLVSIIPGLQRLGKEEHEEEEVDEMKKKMVSRRPYLSEAWEVKIAREEPQKQSMKNWRLPSLSNETEMKHHLRSWAHSVASVVR